MKKIEELVGKMNKALWSASGFLLLIIALSITYDVICRYVLNHSNEWVGEYSGYMLVCITFLAAPHTLFVGGMTRIDLVTSKVQPRTKRILEIITLSITLVYLGVLFKESGTLVLNSFTRGWRSATTIRTPLWIPQMAVPAGAALMFLTSLTRLIIVIISKPASAAPKKKLSDDELARQVLSETLEADDAAAGNIKKENKQV